MNAEQGVMELNEWAGYTCVDEEHNVWSCLSCGHMERFEADGPAENGWNVCPKCGGIIEEAE